VRHFADGAAVVLAEARAAGVVRVLVPGVDLPTSESAVRLATTLGVHAAAGVHPHVAAEADEATWARIRGLAADPVVVAIGETGLDYDRGFSPRDAQLANLRRHVALALELGKPLVLHCRSKPGRRDAQDELIAELRAAGVGEGPWRDAFAGRPPAVLHSFSGPVDYAEAALALGLAVSFSGLVFRRSEEASAEVARIVPAERLLTETDSPYLAPPGAPRRRNEPRWVAVTAAWLAEQRGEDPAALGAAMVAAYDALTSPRTSSTPDPSDILQAHPSASGQHAQTSSDPGSAGPR
jgi:TatD DNase family protein